MYITKFCVVIMMFMNYLTFSQCQANFRYTSNGLDISLVSTSINAGSTLNSQTPIWDFGDGSPQVIGIDAINHTYQNPGIYNVCIEIFTWPTSWTTCSSTYCDSIAIPVCVCDSISLNIDNTFNSQSYLSVSSDFSCINGTVLREWFVYDTYDNLLFSDTSQNLIYNNPSFLDTISLCLETKNFTITGTNTCLICDEIYYDGNNWVFSQLPNPSYANFTNKSHDKSLYKSYNFFGQEIKFNSSKFIIRKYSDGTVEKVLNFKR